MSYCDVIGDGKAAWVVEERGRTLNRFAGIGTRSECLEP